MREQQERARQSRLHQVPLDEVGQAGPGEAVTTVQGTIEDLLERQKREQQQAYDRRVEHARGQGTLLDYRETVLFGRAYAWVRYQGERLRLLPLAQEGITRPTT